MSKIMEINIKVDGKPMTYCVWCGLLTPMLGTKMCDTCWGLYARIKLDPNLAREMLKKITEGEPN